MWNWVKCFGLEFNDGLLGTSGCLAVHVIWDPHGGHCFLDCEAVPSARHIPMFRKQPAVPIFKISQTGSSYL